MTTAKALHRIAALTLSIVLLAGCGGKGPQIPSQRKGQEPRGDSTALAMLELNMRLAQAADTELTRLATAQDDSYALYDANVWIHFIDRGDTDTDYSGPTRTLRMRTYTLDGKLLTDSEGTYTLGKNELPGGVEWNIKEFHPGSRVRMFVPWYMAYGQQGTEHIPPYENVMIELEMK
jgi:predicted small lipoprotein YifL